MLSLFSVVLRGLVGVEVSPETDRGRILRWRRRRAAGSRAVVPARRAIVAIGMCIDTGAVVAVVVLCHNAMVGLRYAFR